MGRMGLLSTQKPLIILHLDTRRNCTMNDRIRELAKQASGEFYISAGNQTPTWCFKYDDCQRFAELIVRECVDVLKKDMELAHIQLIPLDFKMYANGRLQRTIKEHFGVNS